MLAKTAAGPELELAGLLVVDRDAGDVGRQQVGRELDPAHRRVDAARQRLAEHRLADARDVLEQQVALGQQHDERRRDDLALALDDVLDVGADPAGHAGDGCYVGSGGWVRLLSGRRLHVLVSRLLRARPA